MTVGVAITSGIGGIILSIDGGFTGILSIDGGFIGIFFGVPGPFVNFFRPPTSWGGKLTTGLPFGTIGISGLSPTSIFRLAILSFIASTSMSGSLILLGTIPPATFIAGGIRGPAVPRGNSPEPVPPSVPILGSATAMTGPGAGTAACLAASCSCNSAILASKLEICPAKSGMGARCLRLNLGLNPPKKPPPMLEPPCIIGLNGGGINLPPPNPPNPPKGGNIGRLNPPNKPPIPTKGCIGIAWFLKIATITP